MKQVERFIRIILSNSDLCTALVKVDRNHQVRIQDFDFEVGRVKASRFQIVNPRYIFGELKLGELSYETSCPNMNPQRASCVRPGRIPLLYQQDKDGNLLKCEYGAGQSHCQDLGGLWVESSKTCDICLGLGGRWQDGQCAFR